MTRITGLGCGLLFLLYWATGCRSERVAFQFQPELTQAATSMPDAIATETAGDTSHLATLLPFSAPAVATSPVRQRGHQRKPHSSGTNIAARCEPSLPHLVVQNHTLSDVAAKPAHSIDDPPWGGIMFLLGVSICVAAVIVGINIGSWLGLGIGTLMYLAGAYLGARGFAGPDKPASTSLSTGPTRNYHKAFIAKRMKRQKLSHSPASTTSLGEITFTVGTLMLIVALVLGLTGVLSGNAALLLGVISMFMAGAAYGGVKPPKET